MARSERDSPIAEMDSGTAVDDLFRRLGDRFGLKRYSRKPPDRSVDPIYVDEIDLTPPGGLKHNPEGPWIWCSECEQPKFWRGIAVTNPEGDLFLIGETCARRFYGGERVSAARNLWRADRERRRALERFEACAAVAYAAMIDARSVEWSPAVAQLAEVRAALGKIGDLCFRLRAHLSAENGMVVMNDPFVDHQGKTQIRRRSLGRFKGAALISPHRVEVTAGKVLEGAALAVAKVQDPTACTTAMLDRLSKTFVEAGHRLTAAWDDARAAHRFFDKDNLVGLIEFAEYYCNLSLSVTPEGAVAAPMGLVPPLAKLDLQKLKVDFDKLY